MAKRCAGGFPNRANRCDAEPGPRNRLWCDACNELRVAHIPARLDQLAQPITESEGG